MQLSSVLFAAMSAVAVLFVGELVLSTQAAGIPYRNKRSLDTELEAEEMGSEELGGDRPLTPPTVTTTISPEDINSTADCPLCELESHHNRRRLTDEQLRQLRIAIIKRQILAKLRLTRAPNVTVTRPKIPPPLMDEGFLKDETPIDSNIDIDDFYGKTTQVVIFGTPMENCFSKKPANCFHFDFKSKKIHPDSVTSARMWVYKVKHPLDASNKTLVVSELASRSNMPFYRTRRMVAWKDIPLKRGWIRFDIKNTVRRWLEKPRRNFGVKISCKTGCRNMDSGPLAESYDERPFLVIRIGETRQRNRRTATACDSNSNCCKRPFYVDFADIGWNGWIFKPDGYSPNFCNGKCGIRQEDTYTDRGSHTHVLRMAALNIQDPVRKAQLTPCCTPTKMTSISILFMDSDGGIIKTDMPNMVAERCGCA